jgi:hypothetical protein
MKVGPLVALVLLLGCRFAQAFDLEMSIRANAHEVVFGDPLYLEVTIVNRGKETVTVRFPSEDLNTFGFRVFDPQNQLEFRTFGGGGVVGGVEPATYEPGRRVTLYRTVFLPGLRLTDHAFWKPIRSGEKVSVYAVYGITSEVALMSNLLEIRVSPRDEAELRLLEEWADAEKGYTKGPHPGSFGVQFRSALPLEQTSEIAPRVGGELGSLLRFSQRVQEIYAEPADSRDPADRKLVEWLQTQPGVKRRALAKKAQSAAANYNMPSTMRALKSLANSP